MLVLWDVHETEEGCAHFEGFRQEFHFCGVHHDFEGVILRFFQFFFVRVDSDYLFTIQFADDPFSASSDVKDESVSFHRHQLY